MSQRALRGHNRNTIIARGSLSEGPSHKPIAWLVIEREKIFTISVYMSLLCSFLIIEEFSVPSGNPLNPFGITENRSHFSKYTSKHWLPNAIFWQTDGLHQLPVMHSCHLKCMDDSLPPTHIRWAWRECYQYSHQVSWGLCEKKPFFTDERNRNAGKKLVVIIFALFVCKIDNLLLKKIK